MNFQQLRSVRETVRCGFNLTEVAHVLHTSQPGVSRQIRELEDELGIALFVRAGKRLTGMTEPGHHVLPIIERILQDSSNLRQAAQEFAAQQNGTLSIAATHSQARYALPTAVQEFRLQFPNVKLHLHQGSPRQVAEMGIGRTFQNLALFKGMSVIDNIMTGRNLKIKSNLLMQALRIGPAEREEIRHREYVEHIIDFLEIQAFRKTPVGQLPYGLQKRVDLGRALAMEPQVLLLDEPMAGMNVEEKQDMCRFILDVNDEFGTTIVLIEHDMGVVMDISDRVVVLDYGKKIGDGSPDEVRNNEDVIRAYLGTSH